MYQAGDRAPGFSLPDAEGRPRSLEDFLEGPLILYFYPKDHSGG